MVVPLAGFGGVPAMSRQSMPTVAAWIDDLREAFGKTEIDAVIRVGLRPDCEPRRRFFASENGQEIGNRFVPSGEISVAQMVIGDWVGVPGRKG